MQWVWYQEAAWVGTLSPRRPGLRTSFISFPGLHCSVNFPPNLGDDSSGKTLFSMATHGFHGGLTAEHPHGPAGDAAQASCLPHPGADCGSPPVQEAVPWAAPP